LKSFWFVSWMYWNIFNLRGPMLAQSGQGSCLGQISWNPRSSGARSPKYSNSSLPVDFGGGGRFGSLSEKMNWQIIQSLWFRYSQFSEWSNLIKIGLNCILPSKLERENQIWEFKFETFSDVSCIAENDQNHQKFASIFTTWSKNFSHYF